MVSVSAPYLEKVEEVNPHFMHGGFAHFLHRRVHDGLRVAVKTLYLLQAQQTQVVEVSASNMLSSKRGRLVLVA